MRQSGPARFLSRANAALHVQDLFGLPLSKRQLELMAVRGDGPPYRIWGREAVYEVGELESWTATKLLKASTTQRVAAA